MEALSLGIVEELPQVATTSPVPMPAAGHSGRPIHGALDRGPDRADQAHEPAPIIASRRRELDRSIGQSEAHLRLVRSLSFRTKATRSRAAAGTSAVVPLTGTV